LLLLHLKAPISGASSSLGPPVLKAGFACTNNYFLQGTQIGQKAGNKDIIAFQPPKLIISKHEIANVRF